MKRRSNFTSNFMCLLLCFCLVAGALFSDEIIGDAFLKAVQGVTMLKNTALKTEIAVNGNFSGEINSLFSPQGFGGGEYLEKDIAETPADIVELKSEAQKLYSGLSKSGDIKEQQLISGNTAYGNVQVNNKTDEEIDIKALLNSKPSYGNITKDEPYILVYHTHTTEGYELLDKGWYSEDYNSRTKDSAKNMVRVGEELVKYLEEAGFKVIHDKSIYDSSYNGAYSRSLVSVEKYLEQYPSIVLTLDVHRDAIHYDSGTKCKPTAVINGKKAAQVMIISGCEGDGVEDFPKWKNNLIFALSLQNAVSERYSGLMRPVFFCNRKYNMNVTPCSLLLEFGTDANTLEEAVYSAALVGESLGRMLNKELKGD